MALPSRPSLSARLLHLLRQGLTPEKLALSIALGVGLSCFPIFGTTTILCTMIALIFRLNLPAIQIGNYLALPLQLILFLPFLRLGERVTGSPRLRFSPEQLLAMAKASPNQTARLLAVAQLHSILGWLIVAPGVVLAATLLLRPITRWLIARAAKSPEPASITIRG